MHKRVITSPKDSHGHAFFIYETAEERVKLLAHYLREGIEHNELCVLVTADPQEALTDSFKQNGFDPTKAIKSGALHIFEMTATYLPKGKFAANYMLHNVSDYIEDAKRQGYSGLRTAGEMSWLFDHPDDIPEAISYEKDVNKLRLKTPNFTGLCLYPMQKTFGQALDAALKTHPSLVNSGHYMHSNPYYA